MQMVERSETDEKPEKYEKEFEAKENPGENIQPVISVMHTHLWFWPKVGHVSDHVVEDRVLVGSAGFSSTRSLLLLLLLLLVCLLRLVGRIRVAACLLFLLLVARRVTGEGVLPGGRVGGVGHTLTGVWLLAVSGVAVCLLWPILIILP